MRKAYTCTVSLFDFGSFSFTITVHLLITVCFCYRLEQDSGAFFDYSYFSGFITNGKWKDAEDYLSSFTSPDTNTFSRKMFFDLYKWKFSEAPDRLAKALLFLVEGTQKKKNRFLSFFQLMTSISW